jgi:hypothetical protein
VQKEKGYLLPDTAYTENMACTLVYYPDKPEYRRALLGSLAYLATWIAWEKEPERKGIDASLSWKIALDLTMECWKMGCLEQLQDDVAEILAIMQLGNSCCDEEDITDGDRYTDRVEDGVGDVPQNIIDAGYAEDAADWAGFDDYKCMIAHVTVNQFEARLREIDEIVERAGPYLALAAALSAILGVIVATGGLAIVFGILAGIGTVSALYYALIEFGPVGDLADDVATNHDALACAIYFSDGDEDALISLNDKIDELFSVPEALILKNLNLGPTLKLLYAGRYDQQDIAEILEAAGYDVEGFDCTCEDEQIGEFLTLTDFEDQGWGEWQREGVTWAIIEEGYGGGYNARKSNNSSDWLYHSVGTLCNEEGQPHPAGTKVRINRIKFMYRMTGGGDQYVKIMCTHDSGQADSNYGYSGSWAEAKITYDPPLESTYNLQYIVKLRTINPLYYTYFDQIEIDWDIILP